MPTRTGGIAAGNGSGVGYSRSACSCPRKPAGERKTGAGRGQFSGKLPHAALGRLLGVDRQCISCLSGFCTVDRIAGRIQRKVHERADGAAGRVVRYTHRAYPRELSQFLCSGDALAVFGNPARVLVVKVSSLSVTRGYNRSCIEEHPRTDMVAASASLAPLEVCPESMLAETLAATSSCVSPVAEAVRNGLTSTPKTLPPWLFYDHEGSLLFEEITRLPEYYLTRIERGIFLSDASEMIALAAGDDRLRLVELGAGSADKTRLLLAAANEFQGQVCYQPVDVSESALTAARLRLESELPEVIVEPQVCDYTHSLRLEPCSDDEKRLVLYIGSSIGNFLPEEAMELLCGLRAALSPGDSLLLGVDLAPTDGAKSVDSLIAAYDD